jgi:tetratricopeptide (TPR) repeat protein
MKLILSRVAKSRLQITFLPILVLSALLILTLIAWTPSAKAQVSNFENAEGEISGTVLMDVDKRPATQVEVSLKSRAAGIFRTVLTDLDGHFKVRDLPRGTYDIVVNEEGYEATETTANLNGPSKNLVVYLKPKSGSVPRGNFAVSVRELKIPDKARAEFDKGLDRAAKNDPAGGIEHFQKAVQAFPKYFEAYYNMGAADMRLARYDDAMKAFQTSIDLSGGQYALAEFGYGYLLCMQGKAGEAEGIIRRGLEFDDVSAEGFVILSEALTQLRRLDEAEKSAHEALLRNKNYPGVYLALADVAEKKGDARAEVQALDSYLKVEPNGPASGLARQLRDAAAKRLASSPPQDSVSSKEQ